MGGIPGKYEEYGGGEKSMSISVVIIAFNEENNLPRCLNSVVWADEIIVVDSGSTDKTREISENAHAKVFDIVWQGFGHAKSFGVDQAVGEWILSIDADEEISPQLAEEIQSVTKNPPQCDGHFISRKTMFLGRWIYHCGWRPDLNLRLFVKGKGQFDDSIVHETVILKGKTGILKGELLHYSYPDIDVYLKKLALYTLLGAKKAYLSGKRATIFDLTLRPVLAFVKFYFVKQGFRDGWRGLLISALSSVAALIKYARLKRLQEQGKADKEIY